jgi:spore germination cell wall hydrolase CwlJ-like protein
MTFLKSVALFAAIGLGASAVAAPGLAIELDRTSIVSSASPAPAATPAANAQPASGTVATPNPNSTATVEPLSDQDASPNYASLEEAVAAQTSPDHMSDDLRCLAGAVYFESKGEPLSGQLAVAEVILNRTRSGRFPKSVCSVVTQRGQFSFVRGGDIPDVPASTSYHTAVAVAQVALADAWDSPAGSALYFHARRVSPGWGRERVASIGNQVFFR